MSRCDWCGKNITAQKQCKECNVSFILCTTCETSITLCYQCERKEILSNIQNLSVIANSLLGKTIQR